MSRDWSQRKTCREEYRAIRSRGRLQMSEGTLRPYLEQLKQVTYENGSLSKWTEPYLDPSTTRRHIGTTHLSLVLYFLLYRFPNLRKKVGH